MTGILWVAFTAALMFALQPRHRHSLTARAHWLQSTCRRVLNVLGMPLEHTGGLPQGAVLTPNHLGYLDIIVLSALAPTVFVSKAEVGRWPLFGWFARRAGTRFLQRELKADLVRVGAELEPVIATGINLVVFLEGTSSDGRQVLPFKPSLLEPAVRNGWPVAPVRLDYQTSPGHDPAVEVAWWGTMPLPSHLLNFAGIEQVRVRVQCGDSRIAAGERKTLAAALQAEVMAMASREPAGN